MAVITRMHSADKTLNSDTLIKVQDVIKKFAKEIHIFSRNLCLVSKVSNLHPILGIGTNPMPSHRFGNQCTNDPTDPTIQASWKFHYRGIICTNCGPIAV